MNNILRTTLIAATFALGSAAALADACTVRVVNSDAAHRADCVVAERMEDRSAFPVIAGRVAENQHGVVISSTGSVTPIPVVSDAPTMIRTTGMVAAPRSAGPMHVTLSW